jgi:alpha-L-fucosidase 2
MKDSMNPAPLTWHFPLPRPHTGVPLGNGIQGLLIWGETSLLLTVARAGFWDHRGGQGILPGTTFAGVRQALETEDDQTLAALFPKRASGAAFPQQMGGGRLEITFPDGLRPIDATLDLATAVVTVRIASHEDDPEQRLLRLRQSAEGEVCWIEGDLISESSIRLLPAYDLVRDKAMGALGIAPPEVLDNPDGSGFLQTLPTDAPLAVAWRKQENRILLATALGADATAAANSILLDFDAAAADASRRAFWSNFWDTSARVSLPDPTLQRQFDYGLYRQAGLIRRHAPAATLQGPWMEDTTIPPWSNDYHFNINVQLVYGAALATGQAAEMRPLWDMLRAWLPRLRALGEGFYGIPGAMILPHAVDDRCQMMGSFWAGAIDQACIAWMGRMAWQYYRHTGDSEHLREVAWPLLEGAFLGYFAMLETTTDAEGREHYSLPISVSPEFGGSDPRKCWGRDASFQLAALHSTVRLLRAAAPALGLPEDPRWADVAAHLPPYTLADANTGSYGWIGQPAKRIALWEGMDLPESHRHHSHLAGIYPFCSVDPFDPAHQKIVTRSLNRWNTLGPGNWTGWCVPWAAMICSRSGLPDAALSWLHLLAEQFTNEGHATLHNSDGAGVFAWDDGSLAWPDHRKGADFLYYEIMQMDAAMGAINAIIELLVSCRDEVIHIADRLPKGWRELSFTRVRTEGGFLIDARFRHGRADEITVQSLLGGELHLAHSLGAAWTLDGLPHAEPLLTLTTSAGKIYQLHRVIDTSFLIP